MKPALISLHRYFAMAALAIALAACATTKAPPPSSAATTPPAPSPSAPAKPAAPPVNVASFDDWLAGFRGEAAAAGISAPTIQGALGNVQPIQDVLNLELAQPEVKLTYAQYLARTVTDSRVAQGRKLLAQYRAPIEARRAA